MELTTDDGAEGSFTTALQVNVGRANEDANDDVGTYVYGVHVGGESTISFSQ